ncbi:MAG: tRNA threonylcarbamoyladenosine dehydratase [Anaerovoracaceae bacterium]
MIDQFQRTELVLGKEGLIKLARARVIVFGIGGVGGFVVEALVRAGVGAIDLVDNDQVDITNLNRQIIATHSTLGREKVEVMKERILDINPKVLVKTHSCFYLPEKNGDFDFTNYDYIVDAIDTVTAKIDLAVKAKEAGTPMIASMGTGNKLDPTRFQVTTIDKTSVCPLAKVIRKELRDRGINDLKVVYSKEEPHKQAERGAPGSVSFVPSVAGLIVAGEVVKDIIYG